MWDVFWGCAQHERPPNVSALMSGYWLNNKARLPNYSFKAGLPSSAARKMPTPTSSSRWTGNPPWPFPQAVHYLPESQLGGAGRRSLRSCPIPFRCSTSGCTGSTAARLPTPGPACSEMKRYLAVCPPPGEDDLVLITNGCQMTFSRWRPDRGTSMAAASSWDSNTPPVPRNGEHGNPDAFCLMEATQPMSATVQHCGRREDHATLWISAKRDPRAGKVTTAVSSHQAMTALTTGVPQLTINRQPQFKRSRIRTSKLVWAHGLIHQQARPVCQEGQRECTGEEICQEWLYHTACLRRDPLS